MRSPLLLVSLLASSALLFACSQDPSAGPTCDKSNIDEDRACVVDAHCPCGAHCELGRCFAACRADGDCGGGGSRCDDYGRCRPKSHTALLPEAPAETGGSLRAPARVVLSDNGEANVTLQASNIEVPRARVATRGGSEVRCPGATEFTKECMLQGVKPGSTVDLTFRMTTSTDDPSQTPEFVVYTPSGNTTISPAVVAPLAPAPLAGVYRGTGFVVSTGTGTPAAPGREPEYQMQIPFVVQVEGAASGAKLVIEDPLGALTSAGRLVGTFALGAPSADGIQTGTVTIPTAPFTSGTIGNGSSWELVAAIQASITFRPESQSLGVQLTEVLSGLGVSHKPAIAWRLSLSRAGDRTAPVPASPAPAALSYNEDTVASTPLAWEVEAAKAAPAYATLTDRERRSRRAFFPGETTRLDACLAPSPAEMTDIGRFPLGMYVGSGSVVDDMPSGPDGWQRRSDLFFHAGTTDALLGFEIQTVSLTNTSNAQLLEDKLPCRTSNGLMDIYPPAFGGGRFQNWSANPVFAPQFDICSELAEATGCTVQAVPSSAVVFDGTGRVRYRVGANNAVAEASNVPFHWQMNVREVCVLPARSFQCGPLVSCATPDAAATTVASLASSELGATPGAISQELACASGGRSAAIDLDLANDSGAGATAEEALSKCFADLARLREAPPSVGAKTGGQALSTVFGEGSGCLAPGRFLTAVTQSLAADRSNEPVNPTHLASSAYGQRLLGRWLDLHAYLATELVERDKVAEVLRKEGAANAPPSAASGLEVSLGAWDLLFLPRVARALDQAPAEVLASPDYRERLGITPRPQDDQQMGLAAKIFSTLASQGQLLDVALERAALQYDTTSIDEVRKFLPRFLAAGALAHGLEQRAAAHEPQYAWQDRFVRSEKRAAPLLSQAIARADGILEGRNPLGIEDVDLPLYFLADKSTGPGGRFAAVSDFLLGTGPDSPAWAPSLVKQAQAALTEARTGYENENDRQFRAALAAQQFQLFIDNVAYDYDVSLRSYCGPTTASLVSDPSFNASKCFHASTPGCATSVPDYSARWRADDVKANLCLGSRLSADKSSARDYASPATQEFVARCWDPSPGSLPIEVVPCGDMSCATCTNAGVTKSVPLTLGTWNRRDGAREGAPQLPLLIAACERETKGRVSVPVPPASKPLAECVNGSLGEAALATHTAAREVEIARQELADFNERYAIAVRSCQLLDDKNQKLKNVRAKFDQDISGLIAARAAADSAASAAHALEGCFATMAGASDTTPWGAIKGAVATGVACAAGGVAAAAEITGHGLSAAIENAQRNHDSNVAEIEGKAEVDICFNDARQELVGMRGAALRIEQAVQDMQAAHTFFQNELLTAQILHDEGIAYVSDLEASRLSGPTGYPWTNEPVNRYAQSMRLARRATYLAVRAVEYEFQASLTDRAAVLAASTPDELATLLSHLWSTAGTRTIGGNRPSDLHVVLSLRDDVFRLGDTSSAPPSERPQNAATRFRELLQEHQYAEYDASGKYLGQRIPFTLAPLGAIGLPADGIPIYATTDCAERLWSVNASVIGNDIYSGSSTTFARIDLLKQNTFFSQWCGDAPPNDPFQVASVRPARNLFREPDLAPTVAASQGIEQGDRLYSRARVQAFFNVDRAALEDPTYMNGETSELAGRGLYGEYALFIPASLIAQEAAGGNYTTGVVLDRVEDILLRLDYVSVAR